MAISDLPALLASMEPVPYPARYGYACVDKARALPDGVVPFATVAEDEGLTVVAPETELAAAGVAFQGGWARISLTVQSDLAAVGLTAVIATALTKAGISANVIAGYHHDHIFVQAALADEALAVPRGLAGRR